MTPLLKVAVKVINKTELKDTDYMMRNLHREADVLRKIRHENIVQLYEVREEFTVTPKPRSAKSNLLFKFLGLFVANRIIALVPAQGIRNVPFLSI